MAGWRAVDEPAVTTVLVRHGASALSPQRRFSGRGDVPLSDDGRAQAHAVASRLAARGGITAVVASPLRRALDTASVVGAALGLPVAVDAGLVEADFGAWEGLTFADVTNRWPDELAAWLASPSVPPPGGESFTAVAERVSSVRNRLLVLGGTVAVISHVTPLKTLLRFALDAPPAVLHRFTLDVTGVSEIDWYPDGPANVRFLNDTAHLR